MMIQKQKSHSYSFTILLLTIFGFNISVVYGKENPNSFYRLFIPPAERVITLEGDGIHDPNVAGIKLLQQPADAFKPLQSSPGGNNVDWVSSMKKGLINPIYDNTDPDNQALPMDLSIIMEVKGSMPDVAFPHKEHTAILDCSNCHDEIFKPLKGSNQMSMAEIMLGQKCGVCHGSVAFPITECRRCHSVKPSQTQTKRKTKKK